MGIEMEYRLSGRKVSPDRFWAGIEKEMTGMAVTEIRRRIEQVRCPVHGRTATATATPRGMTITGCCDDLVRRAQATI